MNIVFLVSALNCGGSERVAATLCNAWAERGDTVSLILTFSGVTEHSYELLRDVELDLLSEAVGTRRKTAVGDARRLHALRRLSAERSPDVIVSFLPNVNIAAILASAFLCIPLIVCERADPGSYPHPPCWTFLCKRLYRVADVLAVQTEEVAARSAEIYPRLAKVRTIPNPLPEAVASVRRQSETDRKILLSLGRLSPEKQVDLLLNAFAELLPDFPDWDLHIYGDGPTRPMLEKQIREQGLSDRAILKGATKRPWAAMATADAFAMTSNSEGFPNALLEAMGAGLPCAIFDCRSGPSEITRHGRDALLIPQNDHDALVTALAKLMNNESLRDRLGGRAKQSVCSRFGLEAVLGHWDRLFDELGVPNARRTADSQGAGFQDSKLSYADEWK